MNINGDFKQIGWQHFAESTESSDSSNNSVNETDSTASSKVESSTSNSVGTNIDKQPVIENDIDYKSISENQKKEIAELKSNLKSVQSELKKAARANMNEFERLKDETDEKIAQLQEQNEQFKRSAEISSISKSAMSIFKNEEISNSFAEMLYGASDIEGVFEFINKEISEREKALRVEFGKTPSPYSGGITPEEQQRNMYIEMAKKMGATTSVLNRADNGLSRFKKI